MGMAVSASSTVTTMMRDAAAGFSDGAGDWLAGFLGACACVGTGTFETAAEGFSAFCQDRAADGRGIPAAIKAATITAAV
jgi:hypothetical protein